MNTIYSRYHRQFKKIFNDIDDFIDEKQLIEWGKYVSKRIPMEESFRLYYYSPLYWPEPENDDGKNSGSQGTKVDQLYVSSIQTMNDIFEGIGGLQYGENVSTITDMVISNRNFAYLKSFS